ncbi:MAG TPA: hypothetical protein VEU32_20850 [Burkholderiales bacterium]|nr:hypothetical protein [Burkholderiales bacterium]
MRNSTSTFVTLALLVTGTVLAQGPSSPPPSGTRSDRTISVKEPAKKPLGGTRATGDEDETDDLEVQRNKRTVDGASSKSGKPKISDVAPPRSGDNARTNAARPAAQDQRSGTPPSTINDPRPSVELKGENSIPVRNPRW